MTAKTPAYKQAAKQITLIFTLDLSAHGDNALYALIRPMPRKVESLEHARLLTAIAEWKCHVADGRSAVIRVRSGETEDVRRIRRETWSFKGLDRMVNEILEKGKPV